MVLKIFKVGVVMEDSLNKDEEISESKLTKTWNERRLTGKICFFLAVIYFMTTYLLLFTFPNIVFGMYCIAFPLLFVVRTVTYIQSKYFLFLFDNCYFVNLALLLYICLQIPTEPIFNSIFAAVNGPVLAAVLPFRNALAFHDVDKVTSCFIHWAAPIVSWSIRWFPATSSNGWFRRFGVFNENISNVEWVGSINWLWSFMVPLAFLFVHDIIYSVIVHVIVKPSDQYSDTFTYQRSRRNIFGKAIRYFPEKFQLPFFLISTFFLYGIGTIWSFFAYHVFFFHSILLVLQAMVIIWNGGCYYLDYFAYLALKAQESLTTETPVDA